MDRSSAIVSRRRDVMSSLMLDLARGVELSTRRVDLVTELVTRESTAPPP